MTRPSHMTQFRVVRRAAAASQMNQHSECFKGSKAQFELGEGLTLAAGRKLLQRAGRLAGAAA